MEIAKETKNLLERLPQPVFLVKDRAVIYTNHEAHDRGISENTPVDDLISIGLPEYTQYTSGKLMLTVSVSGIAYSTIVSTMGQFHVFCLESEYSDPELRAFALAAQALRDPLANALSGMDRLLPEQAIREVPELYAQIKEINKHMYRLHRAVQNMSDAATIDSTSNKELRDAANFLAELGKKTASQLEHAGHRLIFHPLNRPVYCYINPEKIERAFLNLISNAIRYAEAPCSVNVSLRVSSNKLYITIESDCSDPKTLISSDLFTQYLREPSLNGGKNGIGLGLTITHGIAAAHKGTLLVEQPEQNRIRFTLSITADTAGMCTVSSPRIFIDSTGGYDRFLIELSDILPSDLYE